MNDKGVDSAPCSYYASFNQTLTLCMLGNFFHNCRRQHLWDGEAECLLFGLRHMGEHSGL